MLRRGPSLPSISPHAPVRVPVRACARARARACVCTPVRERARLCPEVRACPAVRALACPVVHLVRASGCVRVRACLLRVRTCALAFARFSVRARSASRACAGVCVTARVCLRMLASRVRPVLTLTALVGLAAPGCGGRCSSAGLSSGLHPRRYRLSSTYSAVSFLYLVQSYCGGSISMVLACLLKAVLGP
jgi:hypothetical protein